MGKRRFTFGQATDKGNIRESNQDAALSLVLSGAAGFGDQDIGLFIIADGMGSKGYKEKAARLAVQIIREEIIDSLFKVDVQRDNSYIPTFGSILVSAYER